MKKKIFISEDQYRRIFLNEQGGKKGTKVNKSMGAQVAPPNPLDRYGIKPQPIDKLFNVHIKNKGDGDNFRKWVRSDSKRLAKVNAEFKKKGLSGTLDATGSYDNEYMKIAWGVVGQSYLSSNKGKGWEGVDDYAGMDVQHPKFDKTLGGYESKIYSDRPEYQNYLAAIKNWSSVNTYFGWTNAKSVSSEKLKDILYNKVAISTCIDPTYVLQRIGELQIKMYEAIREYNSDIDPESVMGRLSFDSEMQSIIPIADDEETKEYNVLNNLAKNNPMLAKTLGGFQEEKTDVEKILQKAGPEFKSFLEDYNLYTMSLKKIDIQNINIINQTIKRYENACPNPVYNTVVFSVGYGAPGAGGSSSPKVDETFKWKEACTKNGGVFMYPSENIRKEDGKTSIGIIGGKVTCCCVNSKGTATVTVDGYEKDYKATINIGEWCTKRQGDVRGTLEKIGDWGSDCAEDWHCVADIASIAVLAFGPAGLILSGIIDAISAIGYVVEQDEGWKLNAGLTMIGAFGGVTEAVKLGRAGSKFSAKLVNLSNELKLVSGDPIKSRQVLRDFAKTLSDAEKKQFKNFGKVAASDDILAKFGPGGEFTNEVNKLNKTQKGILVNILKENGPEEISKLFKSSGNDLNKMVNSYVKGGKQAVIQGAFFAGMYVFSDELGQFLKWLYDEFKLDPLGIFNGTGNLSVNNEKKIDFNRILNTGGAENLAPFLKSDNTLFKSKFTEISVQFNTNYHHAGKKINDFFRSEVFLKELLDKLYNDILDQVNGAGLNLEKYSSTLGIGISAFKDIEDGKVSTVDEIKNRLNEAILVIKKLPKDKINDRVKVVTLQTNNPDINEEMALSIEKIISELESEENLEKENPADGSEENLENENPEDMKKLDEHIKRIKSLFTNERLYGNLVNEQFATDTDGDGKISEPEAIDFLKSLNYIVKSTTKDDLCLGPNTSLGKVYEKYKSSGPGFELWNSDAGCALTIFKKNMSTLSFSKLNLFEGSGGKRFALYYRTGVSECCNTNINFAGTDYKFNAGENGYNPDNYTWGVGFNYIKLEGYWEVSGTDFILKDMLIKRLMNDKYKGIPTQISGGILPVPIDLGFKSDNTPAITNLKWMKDSSGACITIGEFLKGQLGNDVSSTFSMENIINDLK